MNRTTLASYLATFPNVYTDYPFDDNWMAVRHKGNQKTFAFVYQRNGLLCLNIKGDPLKNEWACRHIPYISPGYHMNKTHWITITFSDKHPIKTSDLDPWLWESFQLTMPKSRKKTSKTH